MLEIFYKTVDLKLLILVGIIIVSAILWILSEKSEKKSIYWIVSFASLIGLYFILPLFLEGKITFFWKSDILILVYYWLILSVILLILGLVFIKMNKGFILFVIIAPLIEEPFYRYFLFERLGDTGFNQITIVFITSIIYAFALYHILQKIMNKEIFSQYFFLIIWGVVFSIAYIKYGLIFSILLHAIGNLVLQLTPIQKI